MLMRFMVAKHFLRSELGTQPYQSAAPWEGATLPGGSKAALIPGGGKNLLFARKAETL